MRRPACFYSLLIALAVAACGGDDSPTSPADNDLDDDGILNSVDACPQQAETVNGLVDEDGCPDDTVDFYNLVRSDVETYWQLVFSENSLVYQGSSGFTPYSVPISTPCGNLALNNAFYCTSNRGVYYHRELLDSFLLQVGDAAPAVIIAHEYGHHIGNLFGYYDLRDAGLVTTKQLELQADCWAGAWTAWVGNRGLLETGDLEEAVQAMFIVGDPDWAWFNPDGHGTASQRIASYLTGLLGGALACDDLSQYPAASSRGGEPAE